MSVLRVVGIAGSIRTKSYSKSILAAINRLLPSGTQFTAINIGEIPHYSEDLEKDHLPATVSNARAAVSDCDALILVVPEFNHGIPGVLKNTLDWLSRPAFDSCVLHKPVFFVTLSPGALGGVRAQYQVRETLASMLCHLIPLPEIAITNVGAKVTDGELTDQLTADFLEKQLKKFLLAANLAAPVGIAA